MSHPSWERTRRPLFHSLMYFLTLEVLPNACKSLGDSNPLRYLGERGSILFRFPLQNGYGAARDYGACIKSSQ